MNIRFFNKSPWNLRSVVNPWDRQPSIYSHILAHLQPDKPRLKEGGEQLPDEDRIRGNTGWSWAPGALDGVFGHHSSANESIEIVRNVLKALQALTEKATNERAQELYRLLTQHPALEYLDPLLEIIIRDKKILPDRLHTIACWIATESPDREPIKTAIAILGLLRGGDDRDLLLTLGRHDEFTLYVAVALQNIEEHPEHWLWELGKYVTGWGRINIIERLAKTQDERIKAWLLREGYQNDIMIEYTALICAKTGDLLEALCQSEPDERLLKGAGEILNALIRGRAAPAGGIESYPEGAEVAELYLRHLQARKLDLEDFNIVVAVECFLEEVDGETHEVTLGWLQRRAVLLNYIDTIRSYPDWEEKIHKGLVSEDRHEFWNAAKAAKVFNIDIWDIYFKRLQHGEDQWYFVMQTDDPERIDKVVKYGEDQLPLIEIASGPASELGLSSEFKAHRALDFVLQNLCRFPGRGWSLIRAGLQSPVIRNRNGAIRALSSWEREEWPGETEFLLRRALESEPNVDTRKLISKVIAGEALES